MGDTWTTSRGCRWHRTVAVQLRTSCRWLPPYAIIANPVMPEENFADKWNENPEKAREFFGWLESARTAILTAPINAQGLHKVSEALEVCFGRNIVRRSLVDDGHDTKIARENKTLYVDGLTGGLKTTPSQTTKKVGGHTFFGK